MKYILLLFGFFTISISHSQTISEAVRYTSLISGGTARTTGVGGSFGAMGGDFGVLTINPAGIADFRQSDLSFSFSFNGGSSESSLNGNSANNTRHVNEPIIENLGIVFHGKPNGGGLITNNLAIGLNQYNNFRQDFSFEGITNGSITERFAERANSRDPDFLDDFEAGLAYVTGAIFDFDDDLNYETDFSPQQNVFKKQDVARSGKINELAIAWGGKFRSGLNLGIGIGIPFISFEENRTYQEQDLNDEIDFFENLTFVETLATSGTGFNFKMGLGYTIAQMIRIGFAYQSPTYFTLNDNFENALTYTFTDNLGIQSIPSRSPDGRFKYKLTTPSRLTASLGTLIRTEEINAFFNIDAQYIKYNNSNFNLSIDNNDPSEISYQQELNDGISQELKSNLNLNFGGELAFESYRLRAGLGLIGSPYENTVGSDYSKVYSFGGGFRGERFYFDVAYQIRSFNENYTPYFVLDESRNQSISTEANVSKMIFTLGFKI